MLLLLLLVGCFCRRRGKDKKSEKKEKPCAGVARAYSVSPTSEDPPVPSWTQERSNEIQIGKEVSSWVLRDQGLRRQNSGNSNTKVDFQTREETMSFLLFEHCTHRCTAGR